MASIRGKLTVAYTGALIGTLFVFALALLSARRTGWYEEMARHVAIEANMVRALVLRAEAAGEPVTVLRDTLVGRQISPDLRAVLEELPHYVLLLDRSGRLLYGSPALRSLRADHRAAMQTAAIVAPTTPTGQILRLGDERVMMVTVLTGSGDVARVATAASMEAIELAIHDLRGTMMLMVPVLIVMSVLFAYLLAGRAFSPLERIINEVRAITDGRSLHRRLPVDEDASLDEITRLTVTLNEMISRLETSFGALRRFTADASHELKTPLTVIRADLDRAMNPATPRGDRLVALEEAMQQAARMTDLVDSLLTLARADERRFDLHREPVPLEPLVREVFETAVILGENAGLTCTMSALEPTAVMGDVSRLRQLFLNLVTNAIKYTPRGGSVDTSLIRHGDSVAFTVRDTGIGISSSDLPHIFERFYRADRARSRSTERGGFGLGLAISQWIAEAHGGMIAVRSRLGRGSTFTVTLPVGDVVVEEVEGSAEEKAALAPNEATVQEVGPGDSDRSQESEVRAG